VEQALTVQPYPWHTLESYPRDAPAFLRDARRALARAVDVGKIGEALGELLGERARIEVTPPRVVAEDAVSLAGPKVALTTADDAVRVQLELETEFARMLVARILGRPIRPGDPRAPTSSEIEGATLAIATQLARRAHGSGDVLRPLGAGILRFAPGERRLALRATVMSGGQAYAAQAFVELRHRAPSATLEPVDTSWLEGLPVSLGVVVAVSTAEAAEVHALAAGDVWMPGRGWVVERTGAGSPPSLTGSVFLSSPAGERVIAGRLGERGEIVLLGVKSLSLEESSLSDPHGEHDTATSEIVLDAPLVVRVEMGSVSMTLREWTSLGTGDVIALGRRVGDPVVLRAAGLEIARGDLVDIEGELGVRIRERVKPA
jgi:flagellar motor switch/type III secretory pathway protein FliN